VSRPAAGTVSGGAVALPGRLLRAPLGRAVRARTGAVLDALLHGRGWIGLVALLLVGIVFFNVDLLQLNRDLAATADRAAEVKRKNARLRLELARLGSAERIQRAAAARGLVLPAPGDVRYLRARPGDVWRALRTMTPPGEGAVQRAAAPAPAQAPQPLAPQGQTAPTATAGPGATAPQAGAVAPQSGAGAPGAAPQPGPQSAPPAPSPAGGVAPPATGAP
jgi:cell division protein FtsL